MGERDRDDPTEPRDAHAREPKSIDEPGEGDLGQIGESLPGDFGEAETPGFEMPDHNPNEPPPRPT
jgi:hypothetical protein